MSGGTLVLITGASRGFGGAIAQAVLESSFITSSNTSLHKSCIILTARNEAGLSETAADIHQRSHVPISVETMAIDLEDVDSLDANIDKLVALMRAEISRLGISRLLIFNNAGVLGAIKPILEINSHEFVKSLNVNVVSFAVLIGKAMKMVVSNPELSLSSIHFVNISSLAATQAFNDWSAYNVGKCAREMFHKCAAQEASREPKLRDSIRFLNYAPGQLDTDMHLYASSDGELKDYFVKSRAEGIVLDPLVSARALMKVLQEDKYENNAHIDYWDVVNH